MKIYPMGLVFLDLVATTAFLPHQHTAASISKSSFIDRPAATIMSSGHSSTALTMNLFDRFARVAKSNINNVLSAWEDPEKMLEQSMIDMNRDLQKVRQTYAQVTANQKRLVNQKRQADAIADDWYRRAQLALKSNNEGLAREALVRREAELDTAKNLQQQIDVQASALDKLYNGMQMLEQKILDATSRKEQIIARARTAKTTKKVNELLSGLSDKMQVLGQVASSTAAFARMEEKVLALEAAAEVSSEMVITVLPGAMLPEESLEKQFLRLEQSASVDKELEKLKGLLSSSSSYSSRI